MHTKNMIHASLIEFKKKKCTQFISFFVAFCDHLVFFLERNKLLFFIQTVYKVLANRAIMIHYLTVSMHGAALMNAKEYFVF